MPEFQWIAFLGLFVAVVIMLLVTQTKEAVAWPAWLVPVLVVVPFVGWTALAVIEEGLDAFWAAHTGSMWGMQIWYDRLLSVTVAFFLLQNRARAVGMKSEVWVLLVIFTGSIGLLSMLAQTLYYERKQRG
jgi:hypothetical protein